MVHTSVDGFNDHWLFHAMSPRAFASEKHFFFEPMNFRLSRAIVGISRRSLDCAH
jgi:hypothetical protein